MRVRLISIVICLLLCFVSLLAGCAASGGAPQGDKIQKHYAALPELTLDAQLRTDFGDRVIDFTVRYTHRLEGAGELEVLAPEMIRGITATVMPGDITLSYNGLVLELGALPGTGLSPMESLPLMVWEWSRGYLSSQHSERQGGRTLLSRTTRGGRDGASYEVTTVFDGETLAPVSGGLYIDGALVVTAVFEAVSPNPVYADDYR